MALTPTVIGLHGYARSGKDTVASYLAEFGYQRLAFADRLRECMYALDPIVGADNQGRLWRLQEAVDDVGWDDAKGMRVGNADAPEIRRLLQVFGTEVGRELLRDTIWVDVVLDQILDGLEADSSAKFVITDLRFPNELKALREIPFLLPQEVHCWKIKRPGVEPVNTHISDAGLPDLDFDHIMHNDSTLEDLQTSVKEIAAKALA